MEYQEGFTDRGLTESGVRCAGRGTPRNPLESRYVLKPHKPITRLLISLPGMPPAACG